MTNQQGAPEALRLADLLILSGALPGSVSECAGIELRRLHAENERLAALVEAQQPAPSAAAAPSVSDGQRALHEAILNRLSHAELLEKAHYLMELNSNQARTIGELQDLVESTPQPSPTPQADSQPTQVRDYPPLTIAEARDLTCMLAGAPWPDEMLPELLQLLAIYDNLRSDNARPVDPASLPSDMAQAVISTGRNPAVSEQTAEPTGFWEWVRQAYRAPESTSFTVHNMAVAYRAGRDADRAARALADSVTAPAGGLHPRTANLVQRFAAALAEKLASAEKKYGYSDGWSSPDWMDECRQKLVEHVAKGDPRDVAAYCAFLWHHGASTAPTPTAQAADSVLEDAARYRHLRDCNSGSLVVLQITGTGEDDWHVLTEDDADAAIDAARKQGGA